MVNFQIRVVAVRSLRIVVFIFVIVLMFMPEFVMHCMMMSRRHRLQMVDDVTGAACVDILPAEINFRQTFALFFRPRVPKFTAENIKQNFVAQERTADTERHNRVNVVAEVFGELVQLFDACGRVEIQFAVFFGDVGELGKINFFGVAVFGKMRLDKAVFAHNLHSLVSLFEVFRVKIQIRLRNFTFAKKVVIVETETRFQSQRHFSCLLSHEKKIFL